MKVNFVKSILVLATFALYLLPTFGQTPNTMNYQAIVRNSEGKLVQNQVVGMKISILQGSADGSAIYTETQTPTTNANGLVSIEIGGEAGFNTIDWVAGPYFIKTETDPAGATNYTITGTSQLLSVPYALHAKTAGAVITLGAQVGDMQYWSGSEWASIPAGTKGQVLTLSSSLIPQWQSPPELGLAVVETKEITSIAATETTVLSEVVSEGGNAVTERGILWDETPELNINTAHPLG